ncbi:MAG: PIN domain nuclease [Candidatus Riflebacteria bacterium]|nr:PIN domain nuclease [Candidatus Riflebacteria bacterium]
MIFKLIRFLLVISGTVAGVALGYGTISQYDNFLETDNAEIKLAALLGCLGYLLCSMMGRELQLWLESQLEHSNSSDLAWNALGVVLGLVSANLFFVPVYFIMFKGLGEIHFDNKYFNTLVPLFNLSIPLFFNLLGAYLGATITQRYRSAQGRSSLNAEGVPVPPKIIDTSAIIDGRIMGLISMGFIEGKIIIPRFVMNELQFLADSSDATKRGKGRQGLALLSRLHKEFVDRFDISEKDYPQVHEVDAKLVEHAREDKAILITQDFNLKRVAELQDLKVLHLNDLLNVLKPSLTVGEDVQLQIVRAGKDATQGVGFLTDGTMVVVEDGGGAIGQNVMCKVTNILQTTAGRMIFVRMAPLQKKI